MSSDSSVSDYCRLCTILFKVKFGRNLGKQGHPSSENLFRPSKQKDCFGVVLAEICKEVGLPFVHFMQYSDRFCNPCGRNIRNLSKFYQFIKAAITSTASSPVKSTNILLTCRTKQAQHGENQNPSMLMRGQLSHPRSKVPRWLLNQESLSPFLFWRKLKNLKALFSLILTSKEVQENGFAKKKTRWA